jgi:2-polyprenyl-6-methoxyphenol hydroxylase-like FAD-dependent oxidoreductase
MVDSSQTVVRGARFGRAVVIGGSVVGTLAAVALAKHFDEVTIVDRDSFPTDPRQRKGVPQGHHYHALLSGGRKTMDQLLPGFEKKLLDNGAVPASVTGDVVSRYRAGYTLRYESDVVTVLASRPLIEWTVRSLAKELDNLRYQERTTVTGLEFGEGRVTGVKVRDDETKLESVLSADFVVDSSGRPSKTPVWLEEAGFSRPSETVINARWGYASAYIKFSDGWEPPFQALACPPLQQGFPVGGAGTRGCAMWVQEGGERWILTAQGSGGDYPPRTEAALREFIASIGLAEANEALEHMEFLTPVQIWRDTTQRRRDYLNLEKRAENLAVIGDAVAAFNPVYGQGMTVGARAAAALEQTLANHADDDLAGVAEQYHRELEDAVAYCWSSSAGGDYAVAGVEMSIDGEAVDPPAAEIDFTERFMAYVLRDKELYVKWLRSTHLLLAPDWQREASLVAAIEAEWDELGDVVAAHARTFVD